MFKLIVPYVAQMAFSPWVFHVGNNLTRKFFLWATIVNNNIVWSSSCSDYNIFVWPTLPVIYWMNAPPAAGDRTAASNYYAVTVSKKKLS